MRLFHKPIIIKIFLIVALSWSLLFFIDFTLADPSPVIPHHSWTVAIDPGHGGHDHGARGPTGLLEKTVALELTRQLALDLEPDYRVVLTRSDDYNVDLHQRTAIANHAKADILISLHTGTGFQHAILGRAIYYHAGLSGGADGLFGKNGSMAQRKWHQVQSKHSLKSQALANILKKQFDKTSNIPCHIQGAPLVVLQGADMPAALIEVGHITHPNTEKELATPEGMALLVEAIHKGIDLFMSQRETSDR